MRRLPLLLLLLAASAADAQVVSRTLVLRDSTLLIRASPGGLDLPTGIEPRGVLLIEPGMVLHLRYTAKDLAHQPVPVLGGGVADWKAWSSSFTLTPASAAQGYAVDVALSQTAAPGDSARVYLQAMLPLPREPARTAAEVLSANPGLVTLFVLDPAAALAVAITAAFEEYPDLAADWSAAIALQYDCSALSYPAATATEGAGTLVLPPIAASPTAWDCASRRPPDPPPPPPLMIDVTYFGFDGVTWEVGLSAAEHGGPVGGLQITAEVVSGTWGNASIAARTCTTDAAGLCGPGKVFPGTTLRLTAPGALAVTKAAPSSW